MILWYSLQAIKREIRSIDTAFSVCHLRTIVNISRKQADKKKIEVLFP